MRQYVTSSHYFYCVYADDDEDGEEGAGQLGDYEEEEEEEDEEGSEGGEVGLSYLMKEDIQVMYLLTFTTSFPKRRILIMTGSFRNRMKKMMVIMQKRKRRKKEKVSINYATKHCEIITSMLNCFSLTELITLCRRGG